MQRRTVEVFLFGLLEHVCLSNRQMKTFFLQFFFYFRCIFFDKLVNICNVFYFYFSNVTKFEYRNSCHAKNKFKTTA